MTSPAKHIDLGRRGEQFALAYLLQFGFRILATYFAIPVGRNRVGTSIVAEIDIVGYDVDMLCFVDVKARACTWFAEPEVNVNLRKRRRIARAARAYCRMFGLENAGYGYDVLTLVIRED